MRLHRSPPRGPAGRTSKPACTAASEYFTAADLIEVLYRGMADKTVGKEH
jgi:hypothetical protein